MKKCSIVVACCFLGTAGVSLADSSKERVTHASMVAPLIQEAPMNRFAEDFRVVVRAVEATGLKEDGDVEEPIVSDERIADLSSKLQRFPYRSFRLIAVNEKDLSLMKRETLHLSNGHTLCLRPLNHSEDSMTMWIRWSGEDEMSILDTRLNFSPSEPMIAGFEGKDDTGLILAVQVSPIDPK